MKKKYKKEKRRIFISIISVLLLLCILATGTYTIITYENTKENLINQQQIIANEKFKDISVKLTKDIFEKYYTLGWETTVDDPENTYVSISDLYFDLYLGNNSKRTTELIAETEIAKPSGFYGETEYMPVSTDFKDIPLYQKKFIESMSKEQYKKITDYLKTPADSDGTYYALVCTEFYVTKLKGEVLPKTVEIVKTHEDNVWYVQDTPVEEFPLNIKQSVKKLKQYKIVDIGHNIIPADFITSNCDNKEIKSIAKKMDKKDIELYETAPFTYVVECKTDQSIYNSDENVNESEEIIRGKFYHTTYAPTNYALIYAHRFNVLDECLENILTVDITILAFFIIIGLILTFSIIHTFNNRVRQEEKRIEMTNAFAHNLKTPLLVISGFAENLIENVNTEKKDHYSKVIKEQTVEMDNLIHRMLEFSKLDSGEFKLKRTDFIFNDLLNEVLSKYSDSNKEILINSEKNVKINADREILKLAIDNLIENAVKYSSGSNEIQVKLLNNYFEISNTCKGIDKSDIKNLWQPFYRKNNNSEKGNGIGLSIVKSVFNLHKFKFGSDVTDNKIKFYFNF